jgi:hypothetical protein
MHDGAIVHDEKTKIGEVAATVRRVMYNVPQTTVEDDLAGVSALMSHLPNPATAPAPEKKSRIRGGKRRKGVRR